MSAEVHQQPRPFAGQFEGNFFRDRENCFKFSKLIAVFNSLPATISIKSAAYMAAELFKINPTLGRKVRVSRSTVNRFGRFPTLCRMYDLAIMNEMTHGARNALYIRD
jgi:hypothetical protein